MLLLRLTLRFRARSGLVGGEWPSVVKGGRSGPRGYRVNEGFEEEESELLQRTLCGVDQPHHPFVPAAAVSRPLLPPANPTP